MADIDLHRVHNLGLRAARAAADEMAEHLGRKFGLQGDWDGNVLKFERPGVTGSLAISDKDLRLMVSLGFLLKAMRPSIEKAVLHELDALFAQGKGAARPGPSSKHAPRAQKAAARPKKGG